jgi:hypothetical protein
VPKSGFWTLTLEFAFFCGIKTDYPPVSLVAKPEDRGVESSFWEYSAHILRFLSQEKPKDREVLRAREKEDLLDPRGSKQVFFLGRVRPYRNAVLGWLRPN